MNVIHMLNPPQNPLHSIKGCSYLHSVVISPSFPPLPNPACMLFLINIWIFGFSLKASYHLNYYLSRLISLGYTGICIKYRKVYVLHMCIAIFLAGRPSSVHIYIAEPSVCKICNAVFQLVEVLKLLAVRQMLVLLIPIFQSSNPPPITWQMNPVVAR